MLAMSLGKGSCLSKDALLRAHASRQGRTSANLQLPWRPLLVSEGSSSAQPEGEAVRGGGCHNPAAIGQFLFTIA